MRDFSPAPAILGDEPLTLPRSAGGLFSLPVTGCHVPWWVFRSNSFELAGHLLLARFTQDHRIA